jgi:hypothetical protein
MKQAPPKYYRTILGEKFPDVRIAFTNAPMIGVTRIPKEPILEVLRASKDEYAEWYINGLENGTMATIIETPIGGQQYFAPGELFLKS